MNWSVSYLLGARLTFHNEQVFRQETATTITFYIVLCYLEAASSSLDNVAKKNLKDLRVLARPSCDELTRGKKLDVEALSCAESLSDIGLTLDQ